MRYIVEEDFKFRIDTDRVNLLRNSVYVSVKLTANEMKTVLYFVKHMNLWFYKMGTKPLKNKLLKMTLHDVQICVWLKLS